MAVTRRTSNNIDKDDALLAHGGAVHSLPPPVQLGHDHVLGVVHVRPRREVDDVVDELLGGETCDQAACQERLASPCGSDLFFARILFIGQAKMRIRSNQSERELVLDGELQEKLLLQGF